MSLQWMWARTGFHSGVLGTVNSMAYGSKGPFTCVLPSPIPGPVTASATERHCGVCRSAEAYVLTPCHVPNTKRELLGMGALPSWKSLQRISSAAQLVSSSESAFRSLIRKAYQQVEFCTSPEGQPWGNQENGKCHTGYRMAWHQQGWMWGICAGAKFLALPRSFLSLGWEER